MFDLAIIGAGPAGATLARLVDGGYRVLLVDRRSFAGTSADAPADRSGTKCCGGLLAPDAQRALSELGLGLPKHVLEGPQLFAVRAVDTQQGIERYYQRHYINMNRLSFDTWLLSMAPSNVEVRTGCRFKSYAKEDGLFRIEVAQGDKTYTEKARILIGADGGSSRVRRQMAPAFPLPRKYLAIQEWIEECDDLPYFTSIFDPEITDYYCWTIPKGDHLLVGAALDPTKEAPAKFELLKRLLRSSGIRLGKTVKREGALILRPMETGHVFTGRDGVALVGEAAGWISPSSAEGISYAFRSAQALAEALRHTPEGFEERYHHETRHLRRNILLKIIKSRVIFGPTLRRIVMTSGLQSVTPHRSRNLH